jgi:hypothetical protein
MHPIPSAAALSILLCASPASLAAQAKDSGGVTIHVPDSVGQFQRVETKRFPEAANGTMFRYRRGDRLVADAFLYPGPDLGVACDLACAGRLLAREGDGFVSSLPELVRRQYIDTVGTVHDSTLTPSSRANWQLGRHVHYETRMRGDARWSDLFLFYLPNLRVKVRATYEPGDVHRNDIAAFAHALMDGLTSDTSAEQESELGRMINISTRFVGSPAELYPTALAVLRGQGFQIDDSSSTSVRIVTAPNYQSPAGTPSASLPVTESPGFRLIVELRETGDSTHVVTSAQAPIRPGWTDTKGLDVLRIVAATKFMATFSDSTRAAKPSPAKAPDKR